MASKLIQENFYSETNFSIQWIVSIRKFDRHLCGKKWLFDFLKIGLIQILGGVLINDRYILTAAHCFPQYSPNMISSYSFAMGHHGLSEKNVVSPAKRIVIHASYNINGKNINDITLVELAQTVNFQNDQLGFICLPLEHANDNGVYPPIGTAT